MGLNTRLLVSSALVGITMMLTGCVSDGEDAVNSLIKTTVEAAGANCTDGGIKVDIGLDEDRSGTLDTIEIDTTEYICNGANGANGLDGATGATGENGLIALVTTTDEPSGANCTNGGIRIDVGLDDDDNGTLEDLEIDSTAYVCNGVDGLTGADGLTTLINTTVEPAGVNCTDGGIRIDVGTDDDRNGTLDAVEIDITEYVCNGADGLDGATGATGENGLTAMVTTTHEPAGVNCIDGGIRVDVGLDDDRNGTLEPTEIDNTEYVCNGTDANRITGTLDSTFGTGGIVVHAAAAGATNGNDVGRKMINDSLGNIYVTGYSLNSAGNNDMVIWKYDSTGSLDASFGTGGIAVSDGAAGGTNRDDVGNGIALDGSGNIYVTGYSVNGAGNNDMVIWKYGSTGSLDASFGTGGIVVINGAAGGNGNDQAYGIVLDSSDNIYITGPSVTSAGDYAIVTLKYDSTGSLDASFGTGGIAVSNGAAGGTNNFDESYGITLDSSGNIYVTGYSRNIANNNDMVILKYDSTGSLDASFGTGGIAVSDGAATGTTGWELGNEIVLDNSGNIYVTGTGTNSNNDMVIWKYDSTGSLDSTFGTGGIVVSNGAAGGNGADFGYGIKLDSSSNIYVTGYSTNSAGNVDMVIWKYDTKGILYGTFGTGGIVVSNGAAGGTGHDVGNGIILDGSGHLYVTGYSPNSANYDMVIWKYE